MTQIEPPQTAAEVMPAAETIRFRAANGAVVSVTVAATVAAGRSKDAHSIAREAIAQLADAQGSLRHRCEPSDMADACGAQYWSWALPEGWRRTDG